MSKPSRFAHILGAARGEESTASEDNGSTQPPTPNTQHPKLKEVSGNKPQGERSKVTKRDNPNFSKSTVYLTAETSLALDQYIAALALEARRDGVEKLDRSEAIEILVQALIRLDKASASRLRTIETFKSL